jgi:hypothetical protein
VQDGDCGADGGGGVWIRKEGCSFLKKRNNKHLPLESFSCRSILPDEQKFFASFFQKRSACFRT